MENTLTAFWYVGYYLRQLGSLGRKSMSNRIAFLKARLARSAAEAKRDPVHEVYFPGPEFVPKTYSGRLAVFRARKQPLYRIRDKTLGWGRLVPGGVEVHFIPGTHSNLLSEPHVQGLARAVKTCLLSEPAAVAQATAVVQAGRG
jgi:thioesterase domain-containing protein